MNLAERIRQYAIDQYVAPARAAGAREIEVRAGDIRQGMALENPIQAVCSAIETQRFQATANVEMLERRGPTYGADVTWRFSLVPSLAPDATPFGRRMVHLPVLAELRAIDYGLFPGDPHGSGIAWEFQPGLSLIAGINGLGKTTLLTMILRSFTGPYDLSGDGMAQSLSVVLPENPVRLSLQQRRFFQRRVADGAENAKVVLSARIGESVLTITRRLKDLFLEGLTIDEQPVELPPDADEREREFQDRLTELIGLSSFVDVLLVLHHVILFHENRPGALWDPNAQRQLLRALCLEGKDASQVVALEREVQSADSQARNVRTRITATEKRWRQALQREAGSERVLAELGAEQALLDAELMEAQRLETALEQLDEDRQDARLAHERAKIEREEAAGAIERLKYTALLRHFPSMDDTTRLVMSRIMTDERCLACNAPAETKRLELEELVGHGCCPICGAEPAIQDNIVAAHEFDQAKLDRERERARRAKQEEETKFQQLHVSTAQYDATIKKLGETRHSIQERRRRDRRLRAQLPDTTTSKEFENLLKALRSERGKWLETRTDSLQKLRSLFSDRKQAITDKSNELLATFAELIQTLLVEDVRLVEIKTEPRYLQAPGPTQDRVQVPAFAAEMTAADRPGFTRRNDPSEVSESQRELIDLAFRLALVEVFAGTCTFVMETPEASLDGVAMDRVGHALAAFAAKDDNRLVVTSNLTNAGIILALFEGGSREESMASRLERVLNLLQVAAPNRALLEDRDRYNDLFTRAVSGVEQ